MLKQPQKSPAGFIDYAEDFEKDSVISCHWWNNSFFSKHYHNYYEIFVVTKGKTMHIINEKSSVIHSRQMYIIRPSDVHQAVQIDREQCQHFNIATTEEEFKKTCDFLSSEIFGRINKETEISFILTNQEYHYFIDLVNKINLVHSERQESRELKILHEKQLLCYALSLYFEKSSLEVTYPQWFEDLLQKINSPQYIDCKVQDIYKMSNYSPPILIKYFKQYTNVTIIRYLQQIKINYACNLLETTNFTTLEICGKIGYDSLSHFNAIFKKITGYTPLEYKKHFYRRKLNP